MSIFPVASAFELSLFILFRSYKAFLRKLSVNKKAEVSFMLHVDLAYIHAKSKVLDVLHVKHIRAVMKFLFTDVEMPVHSEVL